MKRKIYKILFLMVSMLMGCASLLANRPQLKHTVFRSGIEMDHSRITCMMQDDKGMLWFGTWIGLCRFDGQNFQFFQSTSEKDAMQGSSRILKLDKDAQGNIWTLNYDRKVYRFEQNTATWQAMLPLVDETLTCDYSLHGRLYCLPACHAVWVSMENGELVRFDDRDPRQNTVISTPQGIKKQHIYGVQSDNEGLEWIFSDQRTIVYNTDTLVYPFKQMIQVGNRHLLFTDDGRIAEYIQQGNIRFLDIPKQFAYKNIVSATLRFDHKVFFCTDNGLLILDSKTGSFSQVTAAEGGVRLGLVDKIHTDSFNRLWIYAEADGVFMLDDTGLHFLKNPGPKPEYNNEVYRIHPFNEDEFHNIWVKPLNGVLCWYNEEDKTLHPFYEAMASNADVNLRQYHYAFADHQKNLWISSGAQLFRFVSQRRIFEPLNIKTDNEIRSLLEVNHGTILFGTRQGHLGKHNLSTGTCQYLTSEGQWTTQPEKRFCDKGVYNIYKDADGILWVCTRGDGLYRLKERASHGFDIQHYKHIEGDSTSLSHNDVYAVAEDDRNRLWIATFAGGINLIDKKECHETPQHVHFINSSNGLSRFDVQAHGSVRHLVYDGNGHMLIATSNGLLCCTTRFNTPDEAQFYAYSCQDRPHNGLISNMIMQVMADANGKAYLSTYGNGISRIEGRMPDSLHFTQVKNQIYPAGDVSIGAQTDSRGRVWSVSECCVAEFDTRTGCLYYFDNNTFDEPHDLCECQPIQLSDGRMLLGMFGGILSYHPDSLRKNYACPKIALTQVSLNPNNDSVKEYIYNDLDTLKLNPDQRSVGLHFSVIDLRPNQQLHFAYRLSKDGDWEYTQRTSIHFADLRAGQYILQVRSTNSDGVWCDNMRQFVIDVQPTFWEKWGWGIVDVLMLLIILIGFIIYRRKTTAEQAEAVQKKATEVKIEMMMQPVPDTDKEFVQQVMDYFQSNMQNTDLQVTDLADGMHMSRATFYRRLKQVLDLSPTDFMRQIRIRRACQLLIETSMPIAQIGYSIGFSDAKYFSKCFKHDMGTTPAEYREQNQKKSVTKNAPLQLNDFH